MTRKRGYTTDRTITNNFDGYLQIDGDNYTNSAILDGDTVQCLTIKSTALGYVSLGDAFHRHMEGVEPTCNTWWCNRQPTATSISGACEFGKGFAHSVKAARRKPGSTRHFDEMFVTLLGEPHLLRRAVDWHGAELDTLLQKRRDKAAAKRSFRWVLASCPEGPHKIVTDQLRSYPAA